MDDGQEEMEAQLSSLASWIDVNHKEMKAIIMADLEEMEAAAQINQEEWKVMDSEVNPEATEAIVEWQEVCNEEKNVDTIGALKDQYRGWHLAVTCH
jgi:hypothetical protein